jgi:hypothetical protein
MPRRCARTDAGGAIGREALDAGTVASGAKIKPGEPGEALHREQLDAGDVPPPLDVPAASCPSRRDRRGGLGSGISITGPIR